jgi:hypothetical protein
METKLETTTSNTYTSYFPVICDVNIVGKVAQHKKGIQCFLCFMQVTMKNTPVHNSGGNSDVSTIQYMAASLLFCVSDQQIQFIYHYTQHM